MCFVSGMSLISYWVGNYIIDIISSIPAALLVIILIVIFDTDTFSGGDAIGVLIVCLLAFAWNVMPFTYCISFLFEQPSSAQRWIAMVYILIGQILSTIYQQAVTGNENFWYFIFSIFPPYSLNEAIFNSTPALLCSIMDDKLPFLFAIPVSLKRDENQGK